MSVSGTSATFWRDPPSYAVSPYHRSRLDLGPIASLPRLLSTVRPFVHHHPSIKNSYSPWRLASKLDLVVLGCRRLSTRKWERMTTLKFVAADFFAQWMIVNNNAGITLHLLVLGVVILSPHFSPSSRCRIPCRGDKYRELVIDSLD